MSVTEDDRLRFTKCGLCGEQSPPLWTRDAAVIWHDDHLCAVLAYGRSLDAAANRATGASS